MGQTNDGYMLPLFPSHSHVKCKGHRNLPECPEEKANYLENDSSLQYTDGCNTLQTGSLLLPLLP